MYEQEENSQGSILGDRGGASLLAAQLGAQETYRRTQAIQIALQAHGGHGDYPVASLLKDADAIIAWLEPKSA